MGSWQGERDHAARVTVLIAPGSLGPIGYASYALGRIASAVPGLAWHRYHIVAVPRSGMPVMPRDYVSRPLTHAEIETEPFELSAATIAYRLQQGMACLGVWRDEQLVGVNWITDSAFDEDEVALRFVPPTGCAWDTGLYVPPAARGGRAFAALWAATADWLGQRELEWSLSRITDYNLVSLRSHLRMGGRRVGTVAVLGLGRRSWVSGEGVSRVDGLARMTFPTPR